MRLCAIKIFLMSDGLKPPRPSTKDPEGGSSRKLEQSNVILWGNLTSNGDLLLISDLDVFLRPSR